MGDTEQNKKDAGIETETQRALQLVRAEVRADQAEALRAVTDAAVARTLDVVKEIRTWFFLSVPMLGLLVTLLGFVGFNTFKGWVAKAAKDTLTTWLSMETDTPMRLELEDLRRRAIVDAYLIHEARTRSRESRGGEKLPAKEVANLLLMLTDPKTDEWEFNSVARVVAFSELDIGFLYQNTAMHDAVKKLFEEEQYSLGKRCDLLRLWRRYAPVGRIADQILSDSEKYPDDLVEAAFIAASEFPGKAVLKYVDYRFSTQTSASLGPVAPADLVAFSFRYNALSEAAWTWVRSDSTRRMDLYPLLQAAGAAGICANLDSDQRIQHRYSADDRATATRRATKLWAEAVAAGVHIVLSPNRLGVRFAPSFYYRDRGGNEYWTSIGELSSWLDCDGIANAALRQNAVTQEVFTSSIEAMQVTHQGREMAVIVASLDQGGSIRMLDGTVLTNSDTSEPVLLRIKTSEGRQLWAAWRTRNGGYEEGRVADMEYSNITFSYRYDREEIYDHVHMVRDYGDESLL